MATKSVFSADAPVPPPFLSQAVTFGHLIFCSGQVAIDPKTGTMIQGSIGDRTKQIFHNLSAVLRASSSSLEDVVKTNVYLTNMNDFSAMNEEYMSFFPGMKPARTCVGVKELPLGTDVEIECIARKKGSENSHL